MESRKVQAVGKSTLAISLPKKWASSQGVKKGTQVLLIQEGDSLKVLSALSAEGRINQKAPEYVINADLCKEPKLLERIIVGNYVLGHERITVRSNGRLRSEQHQEVRNVSWRLIGLGIIEETSNSMSLQCSIDPSKYPLEGLMKRLYNIGATMFDEAMEALISHDKGLAEDVLKREADADMIYWLCLRLILSAQVNDSLMKKIGVKRRFELAGNRTIVKDLESIADYSEEIARNVLELIENKAVIPAKLAKPLKDYWMKVRELFDKTLNALLTRDIETANKAILMREEMRKRENRIENILFEEIEDQQTLLCMRSIVSNIQKIAEFSLSISAIAINRYLEEPSELCKPVEEKVMRT